MKSRYVILAAILGVLALALAGCATSSHPVKLMKPVKTGNPASLDFNFILVAATNSPPDLRAEASLLQDSILSGLRETGVYPDVEETNTNQFASGIKILAFIKHISKVSKESREWYGGLAGKADVVVQVTLSDLATGKPVELFEVEGQTGASARAGTTDEAIQQAAAKIVTEVGRLNSQAAQQLLQ